MTKTVFVGMASRSQGAAGGGDSLEETLLKCTTCETTTMHNYKGIKGEHPNLTFVYKCKKCGGEYFSNRKF